jgi:ubiquinol-cytochrome c reductase cytochrome c subunit
VNALAARRRHPAAITVLLLLGLILTGAAYSLLAPKQAQAALASEDQVAAGKSLFLANCASCHGLNAQGTLSGPSLIGVGAASVDFQVSTGRMPAAGTGVQVARGVAKFDEEATAAMAAYVASLGQGPAIPEEAVTSGQGADLARGGEIFRVNCAMCHNFAGAGGALTWGKYAPALKDVTGRQIYEAMVTGPANMPKFTDTNISPEDKNNVIGFLKAIETQPQQGGYHLGNLGPSSEGLFAWVFALGLLIGAAVWLGSKAA